MVLACVVVLLTFFPSILIQINMPHFYHNYHFLQFFVVVFASGSRNRAVVGVYWNIWSHLVLNL